MKFKLLFALAASVGLLAVTASVADAQTPKRGGILRSHMQGEPANLDCHQSVLIFTLQVVKPIYSNLVRFDEQNFPKVVGDLAQSWTVSPDGLTYTFKLHPNVKFHDGSAFSSADVKASFDRIRNPPQGIPSQRRNDFGDVATIDTPDAQTVVFRLSRSNPALLDLMASPYNCIYSAARLNENQRYPEQNAMGTGGFQFVEYVRGSHVDGKRFDGYFRPGLPYLDGFRAAVMLPQNSVTAFAANQLDLIVRGLTPQEIGILDTQLGKDKFVQDTELITLVNMVVPNLARKPFDDVRVRKAMMLAFDRPGTIEPMRRISNNAAYGAFLRPGYDLALSDADLAKLPGFGSNAEAQRAEARRLLAEAGQSNLKVKIMNLPTSAYAILGPYAVDQLTKVGIQAEQDVVEAAAYQRRQLAGDFDVMIDTNLPSGDDPIMALSKYLPESNTNYSKISDSKLTDLFSQQKATGDRAKRKELANAFDRLMIEQAYIVPMFWSQNTSVYRTYVKGWKRTSSFNGGYDPTEVWFDR